MTIKKSLPALDVKTGINHSPHIVILGAGASRACCLDGDACGVKLPLMNDLVECLGLDEVLRSGGIQKTNQNFEQIYMEIHQSGNEQLRSEVENRVHDYFNTLTIPDTPTIYDYLLLTLRKKDLIVTFNWDPLLAQAFKRCRSITKLPNIAFLHGNVAVGIDREKQTKGFLDDHFSNPGSSLKPIPLLFPVEKKDYNKDPSIKAEWDLATDYLGIAYFVTVIGYSAPKTDVEAKKLLLKAWKNNPTHTLAQIEIIDTAEESYTEKMWEDFFVGAHYAIFDSFNSSILKRHPRRSCESFAFATLQQRPWREETLPEFNTLLELKDWIEPFLNEEKSGQLSGKPHWPI